MSARALRRTLAATALLAAALALLPPAAPAARLPSTLAPARRVVPRLIDGFLPAAHFRETHAERIHATPRQVFAAVHAVTPSEVRGLVPLLRVKARAWRMSDQEEALTRRPMLEGLAYEEVHVLGERFADELVIGAIGRFWEDRVVAFAGGNGFRAFRDPRYAKLAMNVVVRDAGSGWSLVTTETRVLCQDPSARQSFARYWDVGRPGTSALRDEWFRAVRRRAESAATARRTS